MPAVRCPKCAAIVPEGSRRLARCPSCHESLGKCRYCHHYDPRQLDCIHPSRAPDERVLDADEVLNCPLFSSLLVSRPLHKRPFVGATAVGLVAGLGLMLGLIFWFGPGKTPPQASLKVGVDVPPTAFQEQGLEVGVSVQNLAEKPAKDVRLVISGPGMSDFVCQYVNPPEAFEESAPRYTSARIGDVEPGQTTSVLFRFACHRTGRIRLTAMVTAANVPLPTKAPIDCELVP